MSEEIRESMAERIEGEDRADSKQVPAIELSLSGNPIAKMRPRFCRNGRVFDAQSKEKRQTCLLIKKQMVFKHFLRPLESYIAVHMTFDTPIPVSWPKKRRKAVCGKPDKTRPDLDNFVKFYFDAMNELIYVDDNQIVELWCEKRYSDEPKTKIQIFELKE